MLKITFIIDEGTSPPSPLSLKGRGGSSNGGRRQDDGFSPYSAPSTRQGEGAGGEVSRLASGEGSG